MLIFIKIKCCDYRTVPASVKQGSTIDYCLIFKSFLRAGFVGKVKGKSHIHGFSSGGVFMDNVCVSQLPIALELK